MLSARLCGAACGLALLGGIPAAFAHGGEDHSAAPTQIVPNVVDQGFAVETTHFQLVASPQPAEGRTLLFLADADSNAPLDQAQIQVMLPDWQGPGQHQGGGLYFIPWLPGDQAADMTVMVNANGQDDLLLLSGLKRPLVTQPSPAAPAHWSHWLGGGLIGAMLVLFLRWLLRRSAPLVVLLLGGLAAAPAFAHGGEDHGAAPAAPSANSGSMIYVSKASQFLLDIRTERIRPHDAEDSVTIVGRVIPDPTGYARVQPSQAARVLSEAGLTLPVPGQWVKRGQMLAVLEPALSNQEKGDRRAALARIDSELAVQEREVPRLTAMESAIPFRTLETARIRLEQLRRERAQIAGIALGRELITAPLDGIVSDVHLIPGEVVTPDRVLVEILDPSQLRVEAVLHDIALSTRISGAQATAKMLGKQMIPLSLLGVSPRLDAQDMGLHVLFAVDPALASALKVGMPLDVHLSVGGSQLRMAVPREAIVERGGRQVVFIRTAPEWFEARPVSIRRGIGSLAEILGVADGERIVIQGMEQLKSAR